MGNKIDCEKEASESNKYNPDKDTIYLCVPSNIGDCLDFLSSYKKQYNSPDDLVNLRTDRNQRYAVKKFRKVIENGKLERLELIG